MRSFFLLILLLVALISVRAQTPIEKNKIDTLSGGPDSVYVNKGKIIGKKAFMRSLMFPGLGQMYNYGLIVDDIKSGKIQSKKVAQKLYIAAKIGAIYAGGTLLVMSYIENRNNYNGTLRELQYRAANKGAADPNGKFSQYPNTEALTVGKNIFKRNSQVVLISLVGLYGLNALDAYITARLKYFSVDEDLAYQVSPSIINTDTMYGFTSVPGVKLTIKF